MNSFMAIYFTILIFALTIELTIIIYFLRRVKKGSDDLFDKAQEVEEEVLYDDKEEEQRPERNEG